MNLLSSIAQFTTSSNADKELATRDYFVQRFGNLELPSLDELDVPLIFEEYYMLVGQLQSLLKELSCHRLMAANIRTPLVTPPPDPNGVMYVWDMTQKILVRSPSYLYNILVHPSKVSLPPD